MKHQIFDEVYYVSEAESIITGGEAEGEPNHTPHPPLAKLLLSASILLFGNDTEYNGIWGSSSHEIFAVGSGGTIYKYDGNTGKSSIDGHIMSTVTKEDLFAVWGQSAKDVFVVGTGGTVLHFDGISWNPTATGVSGDLSGIWGSSPSDVFAVGSGGTIIHYNGFSWESMSTGTAADFSAIWGESADEVFATGAQGTVLHYDGSSWNPLVTGISKDLFGIWGSSSSNVFAVGSEGTIIHYDGASWKPVSVDTSADLFAIWGRSQDYIMAVGAENTIIMYDGKSWSPPLKTRSGFPLYGVWGDSSNDNPFAVGKGGVIMRWYSGVEWWFQESSDAFAWRIFPVLFGAISIFLIYLISRELTKDTWLPLIVTFIFGFSNVCFVMSHVAMLDVFSITFMLASFWLYLRSNYTASGVVLALSSLCKLTGIFGGAVILLHWLLTRRTSRLDYAKFIAASVITFLALMPLLDYATTRELASPFRSIGFILSDLSGMTFANDPHPELLSYPWEWITSIKPLWFYYAPTYQIALNWTLLLVALPAMGYALYGTVKRNSPLTFAMSWFVGTYFIWIPVLLISDRKMYKFYLYPTLGAICLAVGLAIARLLKYSSETENGSTRWSIRIGVILFLLGHLVSFIILSPYCGWPAYPY